ncbi:MAG TPA: lytic transglycosylase domain-containing protein [Acetobacteraceae bacterium]|nr:lytic transglycosylase domain-containing protein [Acetobacteraceae bacterium]
MQRVWIAVLILMAMAWPIRAEPAAPSAASPGLFCRVAVAAAERANGIPAHLLAAISRVESGRHDPVTDGVHPWPWTANAEGQGYFFDTKAQAVAAVRDMQARGVRSIDVGCGQVNLMHHPDAFPSLDVAFDPQANAAFAGKFLKELFDQTGDWTRAVSLYHSATPGIGDEYRKQVLAAWPNETRIAGIVGGSPSRSPLARAWGATLGSPGSAGMIGPGARTLMASTAGRGAGAGRSLEAYRTMPIRLAVQTPPPGRVISRSFQ